MIHVPILLADGGWNPFLVPELPLLEKIVRPVIVYLFLVLLLRLFGKRELAQITPFDLVVLLSLSNTVQNAIIGRDDSVSGGLVGAFSLCGINYLLVRFLFRHPRLERLVEGRPTRLVREGEIQRGELRKELITRAELVIMARRQGFDLLDEVRNCVLEPDGTFSFERKEPDAAERRHAELYRRLDEIVARLAAIEGRGAAQAGNNSDSGTP